MKCPLCGSQVLAPEAHGLCPACGARPEDRELAWFLQRLGEVGPETKVLDIAPSHARARKLPALLNGARYTAIAQEGALQLSPPHRFLTMPSTRLSFSERSFGLILAPYLLAEIRSDYMAMWEIHRCLRDEGFAVLTETLFAEKTTRFGEWKGDAPARAEGRPLAWAYGEDFLERLEAAGFFPLCLDLAELAGEAASEYAFSDRAEVILGFKFLAVRQKFQERL